MAYNKLRAGQPQQVWWLSASCLEPTNALRTARTLTATSLSAFAVMLSAAKVKPTAGQHRAAWSASASRQATPFYQKVYAHGVSADGKVVVGISINPVSGLSQAYRWTEARGMVGLGFLPGANQSYALGVSADGSVVVGGSNVRSYFPQAFHWTAANGMLGLGFLPGGNYSDAKGISAHGTVVVGSGTTDAVGGGLQAVRWTVKPTKDD
jgi:probable HAF family extracellular repeat protein